MVVGLEQNGYAYWLQVCLWIEKKFDPTFKKKLSCIFGKCQSLIIDEYLLGFEIKNSKIE